MTDYFIKSKLEYPNDYMLQTNEFINFEETKATNHLKDTLERLTIERDRAKDDREKLMKLLDDQDDWNYKLEPEEIVLSDQIGFGAYSAVYKADFYGIDVAVKKFSKSDDRSLKIYANEVHILKTWHHPGIIHLIGYFEDKESFNVVTELFPWGNLHRLIHNKEIQFPMKKRLAVAIEVAQVGQIVKL